MPWISNFELKDGTGRLQPSQVIAKAKHFTLQDGRTVLQIDTLGSEDRKMPGKQSQTIQLGKEAARELFDILKQTFHF